MEVVETVGRLAGSSLLVLFLCQATLATPTEEMAPEQHQLWAEVIPLANPSQSKQLSPTTTESTLVFEQLPEGPALLCAGGEQAALGCEQLNLPAAGTVAWSFQEGVAPHGVLLCGKEPCREARVALVPTDLRLMAPFQMPLGRTPEGTFRRQISTDTEGRFSLPPLQAGTYRLDIRLDGGRNVRGEEFEISQPVRKATESEEPASLDLGTMEIDLGIEVAFRVTDWAGQPIENARVGGTQGATHEVPELFESTTDSRGEAQLQGWQPQRPTQLVCHAEGFERHSARFATPPAFFDCALVPHARISGTVVDSEDQPLAGVRVETLTSDEFRPRRLTSTDSEGAFALEGLTEGSFRITFAAPNHRPAELDVPLEPAEQRALERVALEIGEPLVGRVVDQASQEPIQGATVRIADPAGAGAAFTNEEGAFELVTDLDRRLELSVTAASYAERRLWLTPRQDNEPEEPLSIELSTGGRLEILAYEADGEPCIRCRFTVNPRPSSMGTLYTDGDGRLLSSTLSPGEYTIARVKQQNLGSMVVVRGGQETQKTQVEPGKTTRVVFRAPSEHLHIRFSPPPPPGWQLVARTPDGEHRAQSGPEGSFVLPWQAGEMLELAFEAPGLRLRHSLQAPEEPRLDLELPSTVVAGRLLQEEQAVPNQWIEWISATAAQPLGKARTDAYGSFRMPHLPPGHYTLQVDGQTIQTLALDAGTDHALSLRLAAATTSEPDA